MARSNMPTFGDYSPDEQDDEIEMESIPRYKSRYSGKDLKPKMIYSEKVKRMQRRSKGQVSDFAESEPSLR